MHYNYGREADWIVFRHSSRMIPVTHMDVIDVIITYVTSHFFQLLWLSDNMWMTSGGDPYSMYCTGVRYCMNRGWNVGDLMMKIVVREM